MAVFRGRRDGAVAAEFALITPLFFSLLMGAIEYGSIGYSMSAMQLAANVAAREVAVNDLSQAQAQSKAVTYLPGWMQDDTTMTLTQTDPGNPRMNTITVTMTAQAMDATPIAMFTRAAPWTMTTEAFAQQEMPYDSLAGGGDDDDDDDDDD